jgi:hypothetical protein
VWSDDGVQRGSFQGRDGAPRNVTLVMSTGSHHMAVYWYPTDRGRVLGQFPLVHLHEAGRWVPRNAAFLMPPEAPALDEAGRWNRTCVKCHTTNGRPRQVALLPSPDGRHVDTEASEFGIACEACHGPGADHVAANRNPIRRYWQHLTPGGDPTIVNPARLDANAAAQVCGQCHSVNAPRDQHVARRFDREGALYRPGAQLTDTRFVLQPSHQQGHPLVEALLAENPEFLRARFWRDGMVRIAGREYNGLLDSPCFTPHAKDDQRFSCLSCHRLHQQTDDLRPRREWANDLLTVAGEGNAQCVACHRSMSGPDAQAAHSRHADGSSGNRCMNCHMPYTSYGLLKATRSHTISSPSAHETLHAGRLNACNGCHLDRSLRWSAGWLQKWFGLAPPAIPAPHDDVAASVVAAVQGDPGQRALAAWAMGWSTAQTASGMGWQARYLAPMLNDDYDAIRFIAERSLRSLPDFANIHYDFLSEPESRRRVVAKVLRRFADSAAASSCAVCLDEPRYRQLEMHRDTRHLSLAE